MYASKAKTSAGRSQKVTLEQLTFAWTGINLPPCFCSGLAPGVPSAQVVKLVDTPASGAGDRKVVEVQVLSWAPSYLSPLPVILPDMMFSIIAALAIGLAMDAFAVAVAQGAAGYNSKANAIRTGAAFGLAQGIMSFFGWLLGKALLPFISAYDHWIALILLSGMGAKMLWEAFQPDETSRTPELSGLALLIASVATSIDALAAGISLPAMGLPVLLTCVTIGVVTALLSSVGVMIGGVASSRIGRHAEVAGGLVLIGLGIRIFVQHQFYGG